MEIYQLKTFLAVARVRHLTRAAEQLHITQPAVSKQIKALEEELGVLLFDRIPSGMALTKAGELLLPQAERSLYNAMELLNTAKQLQGTVAGVVRLGTIIDPESIKLGSFLGALLQYYPLIQVKLQHGISGWVLERLAAGEIDAGFYLGHASLHGLANLRLKTVTYRVVAPPDWAERMSQAGWDAVGQMPWVGTPAHSSQHRLVREMLREHGYEPRFVVEADQEASMISLVRNSVGLCLMRDELAQAAAERGEVVVWHGVHQPCPLSFIYNDNKKQDPIMGAMLRILTEIWSLGATNTSTDS
jgi:DNA-binding transcriptional LysR family regulator